MILSTNSTQLPKAKCLLLNKLRDNTQPQILSIHVIYYSQNDRIGLNLKTQYVKYQTLFKSQKSTSVRVWAWDMSTDLRPL